jgi:predicted nucleic acid-binding protein
MIIESGLAGGADLLLSEDLQGGHVISGVMIKNPFKSNN